MMGLVESTQHGRCEAWLTQRLAEGPVLTKIVKKEAKLLGFSTGTLYRTAKRIGVVSSRTNKSFTDFYYEWDLK